MPGDPVHALRALADPTRLALARLLAEGAFNVGELQEALALGQSTASRHLKILADAGLLEARREGRLVWYQWAPSLPPAHESLRGWVLEHSPALPEEARRKLHGIFEGRARRTRMFFDGPAADALAKPATAERPAISAVDVLPLVRERLPKGGVVVDLGTGGGRLLRPLALGAKQVIGIDGSPRMLDEARTVLERERLSNVELRLGALEHLPLRDGEADAAVAHQVLHHAARPELVVAEARRVLKPGGVLVVADYLPHDHEWMREELADVWLGFQPKHVARMLERAGFEDVQVRELRQGLPQALAMFVAAGRLPARDQKLSRKDAPAKSGGNTMRKASQSTRRAAARAQEQGT